MFHSAWVFSKQYSMASNLAVLWCAGLLAICRTRMVCIASWSLCAGQNSDVTFTASHNGRGGDDNCTADNAIEVPNGYNAVVNGVSKSNTCYVISLPTTVSTYKIVTSGGSGDLDLYTKLGSIPNDDSADCVSKGSNANELCENEIFAGKLYIKLFAWSEFSNVNFSVDYRESEDDSSIIHTGYLSLNNTEDTFDWFQYGGGLIEADLTGASTTDFELELMRWNGSTFVTVSSSTSSTSNEKIRYQANSGYYKFRVYRYSGSGSYQLTYTK